MYLKDAKCEDIRCSICPFNRHPCHLYFIHMPNATFGELYREMKRYKIINPIHQYMIEKKLHRKLDSYLKKYPSYLKGK